MVQTPELLRVMARVQAMRKSLHGTGIMSRVPQKLREWRGFSTFCRQQLKVVNELDQLVPFELRWLQRQILAAEIRARRNQKKPHFIILKYRKGGVTTLEQALAYWTIWKDEHRKCLTLAHRDQDLREIFSVVGRFYDNQPNEFRHRKSFSEVSRIEFPDWDSSYIASVAGIRGTTFSRVHVSEAAHFTNLTKEHTALAKAIGPESAYVLESTPAGREGHGQPFFDAWHGAKRGKNDFIPLFFPWHSDHNNRIAIVPDDDIDRRIKEDEEAQQLMVAHSLSREQIKWWLSERRTIIAMGRSSEMIHQEQPSDDDSCFVHARDSYYDVGTIKLAERHCVPPIDIQDNGRYRIWEVPDPDDPCTYVIGADPAGGVGGDDAAAVVFNVKTGRQAASYQWNRVPPDEFGRTVLTEMGRRFANPATKQPAFIIVEANNHGHATLTGLIKMAGYPLDRIYHTIDETRVGKDGQPSQSNRAGWLNTVSSGAELTAVVGRMVREMNPRILDIEILRSIRQVGPGANGGAAFTGRDLAVAAGLAALGLPYAREDTGYAFIGGKVVKF